MKMFTVFNKDGQKEQIQASNIDEAITKVQNFFDLSFEPYNITENIDV